MTDVTVVNNTAMVGGGAEVEGAVVLNGGRFQNNSAQLSGGGLRGYDALTLNGGQFANNRCVADTGCTGGGLYAKTMLNIAGTRFSGNTALLHGGGAYSGDKTEISNGQFENNRCVAATSCDGGGLYVNGTLSLSATQFLSNTAHGSGGGLYGANAVQIRGGRIANNIAQYGGGLAVFNPLHLTGTQLLSNTAQFDGGGLYLFRTDTTSAITTPNTLHEAQFISNSAQRGGGLIMGYVADVANTLFARNTALAGTAMLLGEPNIANNIGLRHVTISSPAPMASAAIVVTNCVVFVRNSIISDQAVGINRIAGFVKEDANLFFGNGANTIGGVLSGVQHISGDPHFADPAHDDYHLAVGSAAIDSVGPFSIFTDIDGETRPPNRAARHGHALRPGDVLILSKFMPARRARPPRQATRPG